jgi:hypothetical protein
MHYNGEKTQSCVVQKFCAKGGQSLLSLQGTVENDLLFYFERYNLTVRVVNFRETFCTHSSSSLWQDLTVESAKK